MKKTMKVLSIFLLSLVLLSVSVSPVQAATKADLKSKLKRATSERIFEFFYMDLNGDSEKEAVGITAREKDELGYVQAKIWYISDSKCYFFQKCEMALYQSSLKFYKLKGTKMLYCLEGAGGSGAFAHAWTFDKNGAHTVENIMAGLYQIKGNEFIVFDSQFDASVDGSRHTWNRYFSKWDGKKLVEYGGIKIKKSN